MKTSWTQGLDKEAAVDVRQQYKEALVVRRRLAEMLEAKAASSIRAARTKDGYDNPNWAYLQADARGYERALMEVISLIDDDVKKITD